MDKRGFSIVEALVGLAILVLVVMAASGILSPITKSYKKSKLLSSMYKIDNLIRTQIFFQKSYSDLSKVEIKLSDVLIAKHGVSVYVSEDLSASSLVKDEYPIEVKLAASSFIASSESRFGAIYQISSADPKLKITPVGVSSWPPDGAAVTQYIQQHYRVDLSSPESSSLLIAPKKFTTTQEQICGNGFIRGIKGDNSGTIICWQLGTTTCPSWSIPVGVKFDATTSIVSVECQKLNRVVCPALDIQLLDGSVEKLESFQALNELKLEDLYPPMIANRQVQSTCKPIINFQEYSLTGQLSATQVQDLSPPDASLGCPATKLYTKEADGSCTPKFNPHLPARTPATVLPPSTPSANTGGAS
ncbi:MAG: prepilin-type N-terminal cleavage/methylation domain-containing protein [Bdellovibrionota bacterium]